MPHIEFDLETSLAPDQVLTLLTDFSPQRPERWPGLWSGAYEVYSVGETWADVREGNKRPKVWAREHYDWSEPGLVRWEVTESNFSNPGSFVEAHITKREGGSLLHIVWDRTAKNLPNRIGMRLMKLSGGAPIKASLKAGLTKEEAATQ